MVKSTGDNTWVVEIEIYTDFVMWMMVNKFDCHRRREKQYFMIFSYFFIIFNFWKKILMD